MPKFTFSIIKYFKFIIPLLILTLNLTSTNAISQQIVENHLKRKNTEDLQCLQGVNSDISIRINLVKERTTEKHVDIGTSYSAKSYSDSPQLPNFINFKTTSVSVSNGEVIATFELTATSSAPIGEQHGSITYTIYNTSGGIIFSKTIVLTMNVLSPGYVIADFTSSRTSGLTPLTIKFLNNSDADDPFTNWSWNFGDGHTSASWETEHTYTEPGVYSVSLTVSTQARTETTTKNNFIEVNSTGNNEIGLPKWYIQGNNNIMNNPVFAPDGTIYLGFNGKLYACNADGSEKWSEYLSGQPFVCIGPDLTIYALSGKYLYAINPDGSTKWSYYKSQFAVGFNSLSIGADGTIYVSYGSQLIALNPDKTVKWNFNAVDKIRYGPVIVNENRMYLVCHESPKYFLQALDINGNELWKLASDNYYSSPPAIAQDGMIYIGSWNGYLSAINPNGSLKWKFITSTDPSGENNDNEGIPKQPIIGEDGTIYVGTWGGYQVDETFFAINPNGSEKWSFSVGEDYFTSAVLGTDNVYVGCYNGYLYALNKYTGAVDWSYDCGYPIYSTPPTMGIDGTIYVAIGKDLLAFTTGSNGIEKSPWPLAGQNFFNTNSNRIPPVPLSPTNHETDVSKVPTISWFNVVPNADSWELQLDTSSGFNSSAFVSKTTTTSFINNLNLVADNTYFWRVRGSIKGNKTPWSETWSFITAAPTPTQPINSFPINGATVQTDSVLLQWEKVDYAESYHMQISTNLNFNSVTMDVEGIEQSQYMVMNLRSETTYYWRVRAINLQGKSQWSKIFKFQTTNFTTDVNNDVSTTPKIFKLNQNFPNPFNPTTTIQYSVKEANNVRLLIFNARGQIVDVLADEYQQPGVYNIQYNAEHLPSGLYFYKIVIGDFVDVKKMIKVE